MAQSIALLDHFSALKDPREGWRVAQDHQDERDRQKEKDATDQRDFRKPFMNLQFLRGVLFDLCEPLGRLADRTTPFIAPRTRLPWSAIRRSIEPGP